MIEIFVDSHRELGKISKYIYGQFAEHLGRCVYDGIWVGRDSDIPNVNGMRADVIEALKLINVPVLRWPGGCFADEYHWQDGIGTYDNRKKIVNNNWGGVTENNHFGTHEFFELCRQLGCEAYINGNVGSGTVEEMQNWVEYMTSDGISPMSDLRRENGHAEPWQVKFFGVGNESWGCGGNMRPEYYADLYRRYQTYVRNYNVDHPIFKIACGPSDDDSYWMETVVKNAGRFMDGISLHHYALPTGNWKSKGNATSFSEQEWYDEINHAKEMGTIIKKHEAILDCYDPEKRISLIVDEWGSWYEVEKGTNPDFLYQQNTLRDAMVAAETLHIFQKHIKRIKMANIAQVVNVLQSMILTEGDKMIKTPTYYVFKMFVDHQEALAMDTVGSLPEHISDSVSKTKNGYLISLCNYDLNQSQNLIYHFNNLNSLEPELRGTILTANQMDGHNDFENPDVIKPENFTQLKWENGQLSIALPAKSVVTIHVNTAM